MPNWCSNTLIATGPAKEVKRFVAKAAWAAAEGEVLSFKSFIAMPAELEGITEGCTFINGVKCTRWRTVNGEKVVLEDAELNSLIERFGATSWYYWSNENWGTKWDCHEAHLDLAPGNKRAEFSFDTAWSPINEHLLAAMATQFPRLAFNLFFQEPGNGFEGNAVAANGEIVEYETHDYTPEDQEDQEDQEDPGSDDPLEN